MRLIGLPQTVLGTGHSFKHAEFLRWIADTKSLTVARLWARVLSGQSTSKWIDYQQRLQTRFEELYLEFVRERYTDEIDIVMFDKAPDNAIELTRSNKRKDMRKSRELKQWEIIAGEAEAELKHKLNSKLKLQNSIAANHIVTEEELMRERDFGIGCAGKKVA